MKLKIIKMTNIYVAKIKLMMFWLIN